MAAAGAGRWLARCGRRPPGVDPRVPPTLPRAGLAARRVAGAGIGGVRGFGGPGCGIVGRGDRGRLRERHRSPGEECRRSNSCSESCCAHTAPLFSTTPRSAGCESIGAANGPSTSGTRGATIDAAPTVQARRLNRVVASRSRVDSVASASERARFGAQRRGVDVKTENINHAFLDGVLDGSHEDVYYHFGVASSDSILKRLAG